MGCDSGEDSDSHVSLPLKPFPSPYLSRVSHSLYRSPTTGPKTPVTPSCVDSPSPPDFRFSPLREGPLETLVFSGKGRDFVLT